MSHLGLTWISSCNDKAPQSEAEVLAQILSMQASARQQPRALGSLQLLSASPPVSERQRRRVSERRRLPDSGPQQPQDLAVPPAQVGLSKSSATKPVDQALYLSPNLYQRSACMMLSPAFPAVTS